MTKLIQQLVRPQVRQLAGYVSARHLTQSAKIFLDANENAFGSVLKKVEGVELNRYPDPLADSLRSKLAKYTKVRSSQIIVGNGSDELIWLTLFAFVAADEEVIIIPPTFSMYRVFAELAGAKVKQVPLDSTFTLDPAKVLATISAKTKVIFLCSPNNPTGQALPIKTVEKIVKQSKRIVIVDEAYIEFCPRRTVKSLLKKYPNLVILRTFSKAWGLAGLRVGYALSSPEVIEILAKVRAPYSVDTLSQKLATKALNKQKQMEVGVKKILSEREQLKNNLKRLGLTVSPSDANFLLVRFPRGQAAAKIQQSLSKKFGIVVRDFDSPQLKNCLRITVGTTVENQKLTVALKKLLI